MSHTPGPWKVSEDGHVMTADGYAIHDHPDYSSIDGADEIIANGRLIAAAPELLALAYQYANDMRYPPAADSRQRRLAAVEAVLAKVKSC